MKGEHRRKLLTVALKKMIEFAGLCLLPVVEHNIRAI
jgi:hypothetical protein